MKKAYITRAILKDYLTIKNVDITFNEGINVIIGKNGTGKTNFINILSDSLVSNPTFQNNESRIYYNVDEEKFEKNISNAVYINDDFDIAEKHNVKYLQDGVVINKPFAKVALNHSNISYGVPDNYLIAKEPVFDVLKKSESGYYIFPSFKDSILAFRIGFDYMVKVMSRELVKDNYDVNDSLEELSTNLLKFSNIEKVRIGENFKLNIASKDEVYFNNLYLEYLVNDEWLVFNQLSDGTKRLFYIISEITLSNRSVILLEEPELGLHPHQLYTLMQFIKEMSEKFQFIITTHSPIVLNTLNSDELDNIIISSIESGATKLRHLTSDQIIKAQAYMGKMDLSDYWIHSDLED